MSYYIHLKYQHFTWKLSHYPKSLLWSDLVSLRRIIFSKSDRMIELPTKFIQLLKLFTRTHYEFLNQYWLQNFINCNSCSTVIRKASNMDPFYILTSCRHEQEMFWYKINFLRVLYLHKLAPEFIVHKIVMKIFLKLRENIHFFFKLHSTSPH